MPAQKIRCLEDLQDLARDVFPRVVIFECMDKIKNIYNIRIEDDDQ